MTESEKFLFKEDIKEYVKEVYTLILKEYGNYLSEETINMINNFNYHEYNLIN